MQIELLNIRRFGVFFLFVFLVGLPGSVLPQTAREIAENALGGLGVVTDLITDDTMETTVIPFESPDPPEASLSPSEFDEAIIELRANDGKDARALQSGLDSMEVRPPVELADDAFDLSNTAVEQASSTLEGLFSSTGGSCEALFQNGSANGVRFCNAILQRDLQSCEVSRKISVDRQDFWACEVADQDYTKNCDQNLTWHCTGLKGSSCRRNRVRSDQDFVWANNDTQMRFEVGYHMDEPSYYDWVNALGTPLIYEIICQVDIDRIVIDTYAGLDLNSLDIVHWRFPGHGQIRVNGVNVWTSGTNSLADLSTGFRGEEIPEIFAFAGNEELGFCAPYFYPPMKTFDGRISILDLVNQAIPGPSIINQNNFPVMPMWEKEELVIELVTVKWGQRKQEFHIEMSGACCSAFTATADKAC